MSWYRKHPCRKQTDKSGLAKEGLLPPRLCRRRVAETKNETGMMQSVQAERVGASLDSRPYRCRNLYGYDADGGEGGGAENRAYFLCTRARDAVNPLLYLEIRNRVWHLFCPRPKSQEESNRENSLSFEAAFAMVFLQAPRSLAIFLKFVAGPNSGNFRRYILPE